MTNIGRPLCLGLNYNYELEGMGSLKAKDSSTLFIYKASKYDNNENHPDCCMSLDKCS